MTTGGEGGMVTTNDKALWKRMWAYKDHGKSWDAVYEREHPPGYRWLHESFGTNWRMLEVQSGSEEHTSELQSLMRISYAVFCLKKKKNKTKRLTQINDDSCCNSNTSN